QRGWKPFHHDAARAEVQVDSVATVDLRRFVPDSLGKLLHAANKRDPSRFFRFRASELGLDLLDGFLESNATANLKEPEAITGSATAAVIVASAILVGELEPISSMTSRARLISAVH